MHLGARRTRAGRLSIPEAELFAAADRRRAISDGHDGHIAQARASFHAGNLYINRESTGALMGVHPFGGFSRSGTDTKAGGPEYLLFFLQGKATGERP
jgi:1-pyrroline-5-carboxylate dehydrogenase